MRLCNAKASRGDSSGGASPAVCMRGERKGFDDDERFEVLELDRRSRRLGRFCDIVTGVLRVAVIEYDDF